MSRKKADPDALHSRLKQLASENCLLNIAVESMSQGLCMFDAKKRLIFANKRYAEIYDIPEALMVPGTPFGQILEQRVETGVFTGTDPYSYIQERLASVEDDKPTTKLQELTNGRLIAISHRPMATGGWLATHDDVTELSQISSSLQKSEARFDTIAELSSDWFWETDLDHRLTYLSSRFAEVTGIDPQKVLGNTRLDFGDRDSADWQGHQDDLRARRAFQDFRYCVLNSEGEKRFFSISGRPVFHKKEFKGYIGAGRDRTGEERTQQQIARARDDLQSEVERATADLRRQTVQLAQALEKEKELVEMQRQFVSMASHEFRTPLTIILNSAQQLERRKDDLSQDVLLAKTGRIRSAIDKMMRLMESTLSLARLQKGELTIEPEPCDIADLFRTICACHRDFAKTHRITSRMEGLPETICADKRALEQILGNLLTNAVKYSPESSEIDVTATGRGDHVEIKVRDRGVGIDAADMPKIFAPFFRAQTSVGIAGTGIGLHLVKSLVELHGGSIGVESEKGRGTVFTLRLPVAGPERGAPETQRAA